MTTTAEWARAVGMKLTVLAGPVRTIEDNWEHDAWLVRLDWSDRSLEAPWRTDLYFAGDTPEVGEVFSVLVLEAMGAELDFDDWADEFEYSTDSRKAYAMWEASKKMRWELIEFLGQYSFGLVSNLEFE